MTGSIYIAESCGTGHVKIGWAVNPETRVAGLQVGCPHDIVLLATVPGSRRDEAAVHRYFNNYRIRGEWFEFSDALRALVGRISQSGELPKSVLAVRITRNRWRQRKPRKVSNAKVGPIQSNVDFPPPRERGILKAKIMELECGENRLLDNAKDVSVRACLSLLRKDRRMKFRSKKEGGGVRVWRL